MTEERATIEPTPNDEELTTLKRVHGELLTKRQRDKSRIAELEIAAVALQEKATKAEAATHDALIDAPLRRMAALVSDVPELFLSEFAKEFTVEADKDGKLTVTTLDHKPALDKSGKKVEFTPHSLYNLLASEAAVAGGTKDTRSRTFALLMKYFGASGSASGIGSTPRSSSSSSKKPDASQFGLR